MSYIEITRAPNQNRKRRKQEVSRNFFGKIQQQLGPEAQRHNYAMGAQWAYCIIGPDTQGPGMLQTNTPSANKPGFTSGWVGQNRPSTIFSTNRTHQNDTWVRGHLINGAWGGSGASWRNLTPLTKTANSNHETIERKMNRFLTRSLNFDKYARPVEPYWYGIQYLVECSQAPFAANNVNNPDNLYAYAPEFIRVTWRAVQILKPTNRQPNQIDAYLQNCNVHPVANIPFNFPNFPGNLRNNGALPPGNNYGGNVYNSGIQMVQAQNNGFDGSCEINQM